jgi:hypothetical protein
MTEVKPYLVTWHTLELQRQKKEQAMKLELLKKKMETVQAQASYITVKLTKHPRYKGMKGVIQKSFGQEASVLLENDVLVMVKANEVEAA